MASYERQTWVDLQTPLDAAHMNHIEEGIASIVGITSIKQTTTSTADGGNNVITATLDNGTTETFNIKNGSKGSTGSKGDTGAAGVGIKSVVQTTTSSADGGNNVITVTKTDGTTSTFVVKNGSKGSTGAAGAKGADGYTPVKGVDYFTPADQESIVQQVIAALGTPVFGTIDENNHITLSGHLVGGTYTLSFEDTDGFTSEAGTINKSSDPSYTNQIPISKGTDGSILNGVGYEAATRISGSSGQTSALANANAATPSFTTGFIPVKKGDVIRLKNCWMDSANLGDDVSPYGHRTWALLIAFYDAIGTEKQSKSIGWKDLPTDTSVVSGVVDTDGMYRQFTVNVNYPYMRLNLAAIDPAKAILTVNEPIV